MGLLLRLDRHSVLLEVVDILQLWVQELLMKYKQLSRKRLEPHPQIELGFHELVQVLPEFDQFLDEELLVDYKQVLVVVAEVLILVAPFVVERALAGIVEVLKLEGTAAVGQGLGLEDIVVDSFAELDQVFVGCMGLGKESVEVVVVVVEDIEMELAFVAEDTVVDNLVVLVVAVVEVGMAFVVVVVAEVGRIEMDLVGILVELVAVVLEGNELAAVGILVASAADLDSFVELVVVDILVKPAEGSSD